jgi:hypothetical protein
VRHLALRGADFDDRIDQAGRADDLLDDLAAGFFQLDLLGVAETKTTWFHICSNSSNFSGRLSRALGRRKPCSTRVSCAGWSPLYMALICGSVTCDSSMISR